MHSARGAFFFLKSCVFDISIRRALDVARGNRLLFIVGMFPFTKGNLHLDKRAFEIHFQGNESIPLTVDFA